MNVFADFKGTIASDGIATISSKSTTMEHQRFLVFHPGQSMSCAITFTPKQNIGHLYGQKCKQ
jgi:hypothetical protein